MDRKETIEFSLICCLLLPGAAFASSSASYDRDWNVVGVGGGTVYSSNYSMQSTVGQPVIGHSKLNYDLGSGFWYGIMAFSNLVSPIAICGPDKLKCSYAWEFGDGTNGTGVAPLHKYSTYRWNGTAYKPFTVNLTVTDNDGMTDSTSRKVVIWIAGDANGDGKINILDASNIGLKWGSSDPCADLNNDGKVTIMDASIIGLNWGRIA
jgi:hypothetical protein